MGGKYWEGIQVPFFPAEVRRLIASIYYKANAKQTVPDLPVDEWLKRDQGRVVKTDTLTLQRQIRELKSRITETIGSIATDEPFDNDLTFVYAY